MRLVIDASVALTWLLRDRSREGGVQGARDDAALAFAVLDHLRDPSAEAYMPAIGFLEIANVVLRAEVRAVVDPARVEAFLAMLRALPVRLDHDTAGLALGPVLDLACRHALSSYDAAYLELAIRRGVPLASLDARLSRAAEGLGLRFVA